MKSHEDIRWFHSIDLGNGIVTRGVKSPEVLRAEFDALGLTADNLRGRRLLDIGCSDGYMSLECARFGAQVTAIDGVYRESLKYVREHAETKFKFYCIDLLSPSFFELGRFDIVLYFGVLYHTMYPFEHLKRLAAASAKDATVLIETAFRNLPGHEDAPTIYYNYDQQLLPDPTSPVYPSVAWLTQTLARLGFLDVVVRRRVDVQHFGRVLLQTRYGGGDANSPFLFAFEQVV